MLSKVILAINPVSPLNWIVALLIYYTLYKQYIKKQKVNKYLKWAVSFTIYLFITIPIYMTACFLAGYIPPLKLFALFCEF